MPKRLILGTRPESDPLSEFSESDYSVSSSTEIQWDERTQSRPLTLPAFISLVSVALGLYDLLIPLITGIAILALVLLMPSIPRSWDKMVLRDGSWIEVQQADTLCSIVDGFVGLNCRTPVGMHHLVGMQLGSASSILLGDVGSFVRAVDGPFGFCLTVTMRPERVQRALDEERIADAVEDYLNAIPKGEVEAYVLRRGGLWVSQVTAVGHFKNATDGDIFECAVKASIPTDKWKRISSRALHRGTEQLAANDQSKWFYAVGSELSEWLVQLRSELASEVGRNIPGQFLAPIRGRTNDYRLGVTINPDTLQSGPPVGISHLELENGLLICGGVAESRMRVIALLTSELLRAGKRVIVLTNNRASIGYARLSEGAVHLELGRDFVLNPVDSEGVPRSDYVPLLISSLEVVAATDLRGAAELELAISRAVTLGNATLADVQLSSGSEEAISSSPEASKPVESMPSNKSKTGMEAVRSLHQGSAARAFYGTQTVPTSRLTESPLTVVRVLLGSESLEHFALDVISIKLAGLRPDHDLVVILDGSENMRVRNHAFMRHDSLSERLLVNIKKRGPVVLALEHPADMAVGAIGAFASCVSLRLREAADIKVASDILGLNVITTPLHTKARISPRESSYLRVMDDDTALLVHDGTESCQPIRLDPAPELTPENTTEEESQRIGTLLSSEDARPVPNRGSLLDRVSVGSTTLAIRVLKLLERYEPLTQEAVRRFVLASGSENDPDIEAILARLEHASMILRGHEVHNGVSYTNYRITMKGSMALRQTEGMEGAIV